MKVLFIGAHTDDLELSCGGTISKLKEQGHAIHIVTLSHIYDGVDLEEEWRNSLEILAQSNFTLWNFPTRRFSEHRQDIMEELYSFSKNNYDLVYTHSPLDINQDHSVVGQESIRAFKHTNLITYRGDWNTRDFTRNYFVQLEAAHIQKKVNALACYKSQAHRSYMNIDYTWSNAISTGVVCNTRFAESFQIINLIG